MVERPAAPFDVQGMSQDFKRASRVSQKWLLYPSCYICKQALYAAKKRNRIHHHSALDVCMSLIQVGFSEAIMWLRSIRTWHLKGIKFCEFLNIQKVPQAFQPIDTLTVLCGSQNKLCCVSCPDPNSAGAYTASD